MPPIDPILFLIFAGIAVLSAISQFALLPQYPFWSMILIAMDILIIWALAKQISQA